jgi:general secretion pathway protein J
MTASHQSGFTLIELLIAMTLLGLLTVALFGGFRFGVRAWDRTESASVGASDVRRAQSAIADTLGRAYPEYQNSNPTDTHVYFDGQAAKLTFLAPDRTQAGALAVITLSRQQVRGQSVLVMQTIPELAADPARQRVSRILLRGLSAFDIAYFGTDKANAAPRWFSSWRDMQRLPHLVRIRAAFAKGGPDWTEMVVTPRVVADVSCNFDPLTKYCQGR